MHFPKAMKYKEICAKRQFVIDTIYHSLRVLFSNRKLNMTYIFLDYGK